MKWLTRIVVSLAVLTFSVVLPTAAQEATPEAVAEAVALVPHTDEAFGIETVVPEGWTDNGSGTFVRQNSPEDVAVIVQTTVPYPPDTLWSSILPQFALDEAPESTGSYQGATVEWTLYQVDVDAGMPMRLDLAMAEAEGMTYLVLVQATPEEYEALHNSVFLPALDSFTPVESEATPEAVPYRVEDVTFENGDVTLAGTLTLPPSEGAHPVVVLVSGTGPQDRDESFGGDIPIEPFRLLADALTREGIGVLRYDDRGVGGSTGNFSTSTVSDFATDAEAAIRYLLTREEINPDEIGLIGHSEGGLVAAMLGARNPDLDFIISLAGPGVIGKEIILMQNQRLFELEGATQEEIDAQLAFIERVSEHMGDAETVEAMSYEYILEMVEEMPEEERASIGNAEDYARMVAAQMAQQYGNASFESFMNYNPAPDLAQTSIPVLAIFGGKDIQVDAEQNAPAVEAALAEAGNEDYEIVVLPDANHLFQAADTGSLAEYSTLAGEFTPELLPTIIGWLHEHVSVVE